LELAVWARPLERAGTTPPKLGGTNLPESRARTEDPEAEGLLDPSA
jgi:hypothetical protein